MVPVSMVEFYQNLWQQKWPKLQALQQAQLTVLKHPERVEARWDKLNKQAADRGIRLDPRPLPPVVTHAGHRRSHPALWAAFLLSGDWR